MDKKQIIIDGVDVSKCCWCDFEPDTDPYCRINDGEDLGCEDNSNCYFKQLARKTQECEELKAYAQRQENQRETYYKEFLKLSRECEKLKSQVDEDYNYYTTELKTLRDIVSNKEKRLFAKIKSVTITYGKYTDLKINKPVFDIEFELIKEGF